MPFRKSRKQVRRKRAPRRKRAAVRSTAVARLSRVVRALRPELKHTDSIIPNNVPVSAAWAGEVTSIQDFGFGNAIPCFERTFLLGNSDIGSGVANRLGWKTRPKFVDIRMKLAGTSGDSLTFTIPRLRWRVILFMQRSYEPTFTTLSPLAADLLQNSTLSNTDDSAITSPLLDRYRERFIILHDRVYSPTMDKGLWINTRIKKRLLAEKSYSSSTPFYPNQFGTHGNVYMMVLFGQDTHEGSAVLTGSVDFTSRTYFTDA